MKPQERRSIVWTKIEALAFKPDPTQAWLELFGRTIHRLWELQPGDVPVSRGSSFGVPLPSVVCEYFVETAEKYVGSIRAAADQPRALFTVHSDPAFASKAGFHSEHRNYPREDHLLSLEGDVKSVLNGMIFHPRNHTHIEEHAIVQLPDNTPSLLPLHEIRVSGGIENAFVFLFHLRYQFCLVSEDSRESEKNRLVKLFTKAIKERKTRLPPSELFDFER